MTRFCTYFDGRYAPRALLLMRSLREVFPSAELTALTLDDRAACLEAHAPHGTRFVALDTLLRADAALAELRTARGPERGWLMAVKPAFLAFALAEVPAGEGLTYVDADMTFLASPEQVVAESTSASVTLSPQRFANRRGEAFWGRFNAGWLGLRHDANAREFLERWRQDCAGRLSPAYSNQKYLDRAAAELAGVAVLGHPGVNLAPWNVAGVTLSEHGGRVLVDGAPLIAYHMAGLFPIGLGRCVTGVRRRVLAGALRQRVYEPYLSRLRDAARELGVPPRRALDRVQWPQGLRGRAWLLLLLWLRWARGGAIRF